MNCGRRRLAPHVGGDGGGGSADADDDVDDGIIILRELYVKACSALHVRCAGPRGPANTSRVLIDMIDTESTVKPDANE